MHFIHSWQSALFEITAITSTSGPSTRKEALLCPLSNKSPAVPKEQLCREATNRRLNTLNLGDICLMLNCSGLLQSIPSLLTYTARAECSPSGRVCVSALDVCLRCWVTVTDPATTDYSAVRLCPLLPVLIRWLTPGASLPPAATFSPPRLLCLLPIHNFSSLPMVKYECLLMNTARGHWISSVNGSTVCQSLALLSLSFSVTDHSVCGLGELWSPVTPWISGGVAGGWWILFC